MKEKDCRNYLAKVVKQNKEGKDVVQLYTLFLENNIFGYKETDIAPLDWDVAKKEFSVIGFIK